MASIGFAGAEQGGRPQQIRLFAEQALTLQYVEAQFSGYSLSPRSRGNRIKQAMAWMQAHVLPRLETWIPRLLLHFGVEIPEDPNHGVRQIIELYALGRKDEVLKLAPLLAKRYAKSDTAALLPMIPYWMMAREAMGTRYERNPNAFDVFIGALSGKSLESREQMLLNYPDAQRARAKLGLAILDNRLARHYYGDPKTVERAAAWFEQVLVELPSENQLAAYESRVDLERCRTLVEALTEVALTVVHLDSWKKNLDVSDLERIVELQRRVVALFESIQEKDYTRDYLQLGLDLLELSDYKHDYSPAVEAEVALCLAKGAADSVETFQYLALAGIAAAHRSDLAEAEKQLNAALAAVQDNAEVRDRLHGWLARIYRRTGRLEEAAHASGLIRGKTPQEFYEAGQIHFARADDRMASEAWSALLTSGKISIVSLLGASLIDFYRDFFTAALRSNRMEMSLRLASMLLHEPGFTMEGVIGLAKAAIPKDIARQRIFFKQFLAQAPKEMRPLLENEFGMEKKPKDEEGAVDDKQAVRVKWEHLKANDKVRLMDVENLFTSRPWQRLEGDVAWRRQLLATWALEWWEWPASAKKSGSLPPMSKRPEILQRLVKEIDQTLQAEDRLTLEGKSHALNTEWLAEFAEYLQLWLTSGSANSRNAERIYNPQPLKALRQTVKAALQTVQLLRLSRPWKELANKVADLAEHSIDDFFVGPKSKELRSQLAEFQVQAQKLDESTPSHMKLAFKPVVLRALDPLEKLSNDLRSEESRREFEASLQALKSRQRQAAQALSAFKQRWDAESAERDRLDSIFGQFESALVTYHVPFKPMAGGFLLGLTPPVGVIRHAGQVVLVDAAPEPRVLRRIYIQNGQVIAQDDHKQEVFRTNGRLAGIQVTLEGQVRFFLTDRAFDAVIGWLESHKTTTSLELWPERAIQSLPNVLTGGTTTRTASPSAAPPKEDRQLAAKLKEAS